jgi:hypothetical protein
VAIMCIKVRKIMNARNFLIPVFSILFLMISAGVQASGDDETSIRIVINTDPSSADIVQTTVDNLGLGNDIDINILTNETDVTRELEHSQFEHVPPEQVLMIAWHDAAKDFLQQHPEKVDNIIIVNSTENGINYGLAILLGREAKRLSNKLALHLGSIDLLIGSLWVVVGLAIGAGCGFLIGKKKRKLKTAKDGMA